MYLFLDSVVEFENMKAFILYRNFNFQLLQQLFFLDDTECLAWAFQVYACGTSCQRY